MTLLVKGVGGKVKNFLYSFRVKLFIFQLAY